MGDRSELEIGLPHTETLVPAPGQRGEGRCRARAHGAARSDSRDRNRARQTILPSRACRSSGCSGMPFLISESSSEKTTIPSGFIQKQLGEHSSRRRLRALAMPRRYGSVTPRSKNRGVRVGGRPLSTATRSAPCVAPDSIVRSHHPPHGQARMPALRRPAAGPGCIATNDPGRPASHRTDAAHDLDGRVVFAFSQPRTRASAPTTSGSNCVPRFASSSHRASSGLIAAR